jgi:hypothetical protein
MAKREYAHGGRKRRFVVRAGLNHARKATEAGILSKSEAHMLL